ncbi:hypothetical protein SAMN05216226_106127 [Halovenus aranensis]|jgi:hypothetical protein|uniref:RecA-superfamily ATPase, KaiC/GvpD/RAD55 family n=1 Tax=Halovenus aranensis TaxID=890420 RepID=A0A1G8VC73_9EURY|nr:hypothetical protein [Halovenus aranensis]SDJ63504.1 hypothetical protein SAMN05216226_106127 [Halovenus aranensis]
MTEQPYKVPTLPLEPVAPGTTLLVTGPRRLGTEVAERLVLEKSDEEGAIFVSTNMSGRNFLRRCLGNYPNLPPESVGFVDASGRRDVDVDTAMRLRDVSSPGDLTGISIATSVLSAALADDSLTRVRTGYVSLSVLLLYTNPKVTTRFVHTVRGRAGATDGLVVFALDPSMHQQSVTHTFEHVCDGRVRTAVVDGEPVLRVDGLGDQPADWVPVDG